MDEDAAAQPAILIVDDDPTVGDVIGRMVRRAIRGAKVRVVASGAQALDVLTAQPIALVLTDLRMPGMDGAQLTQAIKARWPTAKVVLISGSTDQLLSQVAQAVQADGYLLKPFSRAELASVLQPLLGN
jgi:two-component system, response regulator YesN